MECVFTCASSDGLQINTHTNSGHKMLRTGHVCFGAKIRDKEGARKKVQYGGHRPKPVFCLFYVSSKCLGAFRVIFTLFPMIGLFSSVPTHHMYVDLNLRSGSMYGGNTEGYFHVNPKVAYMGKGKFTFLKLVAFYRFHHMCLGANLRAKGRQAGKETQRHKEENSNGFSLSSGQSVCTSALCPFLRCQSQIGL